MQFCAILISPSLSLSLNNLYPSDRRPAKSSAQYPYSMILFSIDAKIMQKMSNYQILITIVSILKVCFKFMVCLLFGYTTGQYVLILNFNVVFEKLQHTVIFSCCHFSVLYLNYVASLARLKVNSLRPHLKLT